MQIRLAHARSHFCPINSAIKFPHIKERSENKVLSDIPGLIANSASYKLHKFRASNRVNGSLNEVVCIRKLTLHWATRKH